MPDPTGMITSEFRGGLETLAQAARAALLPVVEAAEQRVV
jgi:hypothetical protein